MRVITNWRNELIDWGVLLPRTFVTLQFQTYQNNIKDVAEVLQANISTWATGALTETWREPTNCAGVDQTSKSVVHVA